MAGRPPHAPDADTYAGRLGARLRVLRSRRKMAAEDVAEAIGVHVATYYRWELGEVQMPVERLPAVAEALGVRMKTLLP